MTGRSVVVWDDALLAYDPGPGHPLRAVRLELTMALARMLGLLERPDVELRAPEPALDATLLLVHDEEYLAAVRAGRPALEHGLGDTDNPTFPGLHAAAALVTGASVAAAQAVWSGEAQHGVSIAGGLHHAHHDRAAGFCVYCDPAVAIAWLLQAGARRVAYVDVDAHNGDGVSEAFAADPRVMTISLHQEGTTAFPGNGFPEEIGTGDAEGDMVNVALPPFTDDAGWLRAFSGVVPVLLRSFEPEVLVTQGGCDGHRDDHMADLSLTVDGLTAAYSALHELAHELCDGRWLVLGGGGYDLAGVVPRAWTAMLAIATGDPLPPDTALPQQWRELVAERCGSIGPAQLGDGASARFAAWDAGTGDVEDALDRSVAATRNAVLPLHGLDPMRDR